MKNFVIPALLGAALLAPANAAYAGTRSLIVTGSDLTSFVVAEANSLGIVFDSAITGIAAVNITLPKNYKKNSPVTAQARFLMGGTGCNVYLTAPSAIRVRPGSILSVEVGAASGFTINGSAAVAVSPVPLRAFTKAFTLRKAISGAILNQKAGDNVIMLISRDATDVSDTCVNDLILTSVKVTYTTN